MPRLALYLSLLLIGGCSTFVEQKQIALSEEVVWQVQPYQSSLIVAQTQVLTAIYGNESHKMLVQSELSDDALNMVALSLQGLPLFELKLDSHGNISSKRYLPISVKPEYIISDMQLIQFPLSRIRQYIRGADVIETQHSGFKRRVIRANSKDIITIEYHPDITKFEHTGRQYKLLLEALD